MAFQVKNGYVLVTPVASAEYELSGSFIAGKIAVGPEQDLGVGVFFADYELFNTEYMLVKVEDVKVWLKPEVVADAPKEDSAQ